MSIYTCKKCGGLYATENGEMFGGKPCDCFSMNRDLDMRSQQLEEIRALRDENSRLKGQIEKALDMGAENYRAANGYMELLDREKVVSELLRTDLTTLRTQLAKLTAEAEKLRDMELFYKEELEHAKETNEKLRGDDGVPYKCPVCSGRGNVPAGFYGYISSNVAPEPCKSCGGQGIVYTRQADAAGQKDEK